MCFPNMSSSKLKEVLVCPDFERGHILKHVFKAFISKVELSCGQHIHASKGLATTTDCRFSGRVYSPRCVVYFDLKKQDLKSLLISNQLKSQPFCLGGKRLFLSAQLQEQYHLGLFVYRVQGSKACTIDFEFAVMDKSSKEFKSKCKANKVTINDNDQGTRNLLGIARTEFMSDDCDYFINDVLHIRAELTLSS